MFAQDFRPRPRPPTPRARTAVLLATAMSLALLSSPVQAQPAAPAKPAFAAPTAASHDMRPIVIALGAVAGVVAFNVVALGLEAIPGGFAYGAGVTVPAEMSVAMSRVYAVSSGAIGGLVAHHQFTGSEFDDGSTGRQIVIVGAGAVAGAALFNVLSAPLGTVPLAGGALAPVAVNVALGSRLIAVSAMSGGALAATWLYDRWTGYRS